MQFIILVVSLLLGLLVSVNAGGQKGPGGVVNPPIITKTGAPTSSWAPTTRPTLRPSLKPTGRPTRSPSKAPSSPPTKKPTGSPAPSKTSTPTVHPSLFPTVQPTASVAPTGTPSAQPTAIFSVPIPPMVLTYQTSSQPDSNDWSTQVLAFLNMVFHNNYDNQDFQNLNLDVLLNQATSSSKVDGVAVFKGPSAPTQDDIRTMLMAYFKYWGIDDFSAFLNSAGIPVSNLQVSFDNQVADSQTAVTKTTNDSKGSSEGGILAGVLVAAAFVVLVGIFVIRRRRQPEKSTEILSDVVDPPQDATPVTRGRPISPEPEQRPWEDSVVTGAANQESIPTDHSVLTFDNDFESEKLSSAAMDSMSLMDGLSAIEGMSVATTDNQSDILTLDGSMAPKGDNLRILGPAPPIVYDASRLDQVISNAKGYYKDTDGGNDDDSLPPPPPPIHDQA